MSPHKTITELGTYSLAAAVTVFAIGCGTNELGLHSATEIGDMSLGEAPAVRFDSELVAACGQHSPLAREAELLHRAPFVQQVTDAGARVLFVGEPARYELEVTTPGGEVVSRGPAAVDPVTTLAGEQYQVEIDGLEPASIYCYRLDDEAGAVTAPVGFRTAPALGADAKIRFAVFSDLGTGTIDQLAVRDQLEEHQVDFVLIGGDVAYVDGTRQQIQDNFFDIYTPLLRSVPFFVASGNHDLQTQDGLPLREAFALPENGGTEGLEKWYSFDWGQLHVVVLDAEKAGSDAQAAWLEADLAATDQPWRIAVVHRPPYSSGWHGGNGGVRDNFVPLFEEYGVTMVFSGDDHNYERTVEMNGVTYIVTGGGGRGTRGVGTSDFTAFSEQVAHFVYAELDGSALKTWAVDATGSTFDTLRIDW